MKKSVRKLSLSRETLRALDDVGLCGVAGGHTHRCQPITTAQCTTGTCDYTLGCTQAVCTNQ